MSERPILFLDIDGVLSIRLMMAHCPPPRLRGYLGHPTARRAVTTKGPRLISAAAVSHLNRILQQAEPLIVVTSSWRLRGDCRPVLREHGVAGDFHEDWRTDADGPDRSGEIARWLDVHGRPRYVLLDDWADALHGHLHRLVHTDFRTGLAGQDVETALRLLA